MNRTHDYKNEDVQKIIEKIDYLLHPITKNSGDEVTVVIEKKTVQQLGSEIVYALASCLHNARTLINKIHGHNFDLRGQLIDVEKTDPVSNIDKVLKESLQETKTAIVEHKGVVDEIKSYSEALRGDLRKCGKTSPTSLDIGSIEKAVKKSVTDANIQRDRSCSVMLYGISSEELSYENDFVEVKKLLLNISADESALVGVYRVGRESDHGPDLRPVRATLRDSVAAQACLRRAPLLKTEGYQSVFMAPDLPRSDQLKRKELVKQLKTAIADTPERYWIIRDNKIVDKGEKRSTAMSGSGHSVNNSPMRTRSSSRMNSELLND